MTLPQASSRSVSSVEQELHALHLAAGIFILEVDHALQVVHATPGLAGLLGWHAPGLPALGAVPAAYPQLLGDVASVLHHGAEPRRELSLGGRRFVANGRRRLYPDGTCHAVFRFIDLAGLVREHDLVRLAADSTDDYAILTLDAEGRVTSWNSAAERVFGHTEADILGRHFELLFVAEDRVNGVPAAEMRRAREDGRAEDERWHLRADGKRFYCSGVLTPLRDGHLHGYAKIARDLTARKRAEREREVLLRHERIVRARAQAANQLKDEFLAVMSHELKHPLNLIYANAELLTRLAEVQASAAGSRAAQAIQRAVIAQAKIIDDLLDLSRLHTGKLRLAPARVDWRRIVEAVVQACADEARAQQVTLSFEDGASVWLYADEVRIEQVVWNLVSNAIKFTPAGGHVDVRLHAHGPREADAAPATPYAGGHPPAGAWLEVCDTGRGIAAATLPRIFEMFAQADGHTTRRQSGLGVGLALVRQLAELHGGRVEAHSAGEGQGAKFSVWLPTLCEPEQEPGQRAGEDEAGQADRPGAGRLDGVRVLLVDDSQETLEAFHQLLMLEGARVTSVTSGAAALERAGDEDYDVILSDIGMPEMDGHELLARLREQPRHAGVPAIALTGFGRSEDVRRALAAGFNTHLNKPVRLQSLLEALAGLLAQRSS